MNQWKQEERVEYVCILNEQVPESGRVGGRMLKGVHLKQARLKILSSF